MNNNQSSSNYVERRSSDRPWGQSSESREQEQPMQEKSFQHAVGSDVNDQQWQEF